MSFSGSLAPSPFPDVTHLSFRESSPSLYHPDGNINLNACPPITETKGVLQRLLWDHFYTIPGIGWPAQNTRLVNKTQSLGTWFIKQTMYIPWRSKWQPTPVFLPGESLRQRSLAGYSPQGYKELDMTERLHFLY